MSKNDDKILLLKKQVDAKKAELGKAKRFAPITSCSIELDGTRYNLHASSREQLIYLLCKVNLLSVAAEEVGYPGECVVSGFSTEDWGADIRCKLAMLDQKQEEAKLKAMEAKLDKLLSEDKKTELELAEIEALLG